MSMIVYRQEEMEVSTDNPPSTLSVLSTENQRVLFLALHFQLSVANSADQAFADAEFVYTPLLDEKRDAELLDLLPDYLTEEICFPRNHVAKFYMKVLDSMAKRVEVERE